MGTHSAAPARPRTVRAWSVAIIGLLIMAGAAAVVAPRVLAGRRPAATLPPTAQVTTVVAVSGVEASGAVAAQQTGAVAWKTTGTVDTVRVRVGDWVAAGDVLMTLDPRTAPQSVIQAQADLLSAQSTLATVRAGSTAQQLANASLAVIQAEDALATAERNLDRVISPQVAYYQDQAEDAQAALEAAQQNAEITGFQASLRSASDALQAARSKLEDVQALDAQYPGYGAQNNRLGNAQTAYARALQDYQAALYQLEQSQHKNDEALDTARQELETAQANLAAAQAGPDQAKVARYQAELAVAQANLAQARADLAELRAGPKAEEVAAAEARVAGLQATLAALTVTAPYAGEVLEVGYQVGDSATQSEAAVVIANRTQLHVDASVDEADVAQIQVGDPVTVTFDALPGVTLAGPVAQINPLGEAVQGLVKYTVRVDLAGSEPGVLLGMTANLQIVTNVQADALAVPIEAVQLDDAGEFVLRLGALGGTERVPVVSGRVLDAATTGAATDLVLVTGALEPGDVVQLVASEPNTNAGPRGFFGARGGP